MAEGSEAAEIKAPLLPTSKSHHQSSEDLEASTHSPTENFPDTSNELGIERLDYDPVFSFVHAKTNRVKRNRRVYGYTGATLAKWSITICIGILVGLAAYVIESSQEFLISQKKSYAQKTVEKNVFLSFLGFVSFSILLVLIASCLVLFWAPPAAGGGVTLVMAYLNGNDIPDFFRFSTLVTKIIGTACSISSGLLVGQEAPMVHIGAAIASTMTWMHGSMPGTEKKHESTSCSCCNPQFNTFDFYSDKDRREFISAGAAAGLAAAFGAPIGGVLYSLEEASSFWSKKVMWRSLLCCTFATMLMALINDWQFSKALPGSMAFPELKPAFDIKDLPLYALTSALSGIIGAFVNIAHDWVNQWRPAPSRKIARLLEVCLITSICVAVMYTLPFALGNCVETPAHTEGTKEENYWLRYTCSAGEYNDLATLFFSLPRKSMHQLYNVGGVKNNFPITTLAIHSVSVLVLFIMAYGTAVPGGIFMPSMLAGASFGACIGKLFEKLLPSENIQPGLHAIVGSTAMLGGVFRSSISLVVIMVEGTGGIEFILPIIVAIVVSNWVAHHIYHTGAYEADLEHLAGVFFMQGEPPHELIALTASDIMSPNVISFYEVVSVREVVEVLRNTRHNGFAVLRHTGSDGNGKYVGMILRHQLLVLLESGHYNEVDVPIHQVRFSLYDRQIPEELVILERAMRVYHHHHNPHRRFLSSRPEAVNSIQLTSPETNDNDPPNKSSSKKTLALDLRPFMNHSPLAVRRDCSAQRVYMLFRALGLRHLCVTDSHNRVLGIITRKDIALAQKQGFVTKSLQHWDSDTRSPVEDSELKKNRDRMFTLP